jgi:hypothetical protein
MGSAVGMPVPGAGGGRAAMSQRIRQSLFAFLPVLVALAEISARRW